jgi:formylglycine-generating enzyme required for sulfatase activity
VLRGGAFINNAFNVRSGTRSFSTPLAADYYIGFRCAQDATP